MVPASLEAYVCLASLLACAQSIHALLLAVHRPPHQPALSRTVCTSPSLTGFAQFSSSEAAGWQDIEKPALSSTLCMHAVQSGPLASRTVKVFSPRCILMPAVGSRAIKPPFEAARPCRRTPAEAPPVKGLLRIARLPEQARLLRAQQALDARQLCSALARLRLCQQLLCAQQQTNVNLGMSCQESQFSCCLSSRPHTYITCHRVTVSCMSTTPEAVERFSASTSY